VLKRRLNVGVTMRIVLALFLAVAGCGVPVEESAADEAALAGGCRSVCPKCRPGQVCPRIACYLDCNAPTPCGPAKCANGQVCCNESCGICTEPGGFCTDQYCAPVEKGHRCDVIALCIPGYHWSEAKCGCLPDKDGAPAGCTSDADCRTFSNYCTGCNCDALGAHDPDPTCDGPGVQCFADPCMNQTAVCLAGTCSLQTATF
jgi:hypothetical protein